MKSGYYGGGSALIDEERALGFERLAKIHEGTDIGLRYRQRAFECWHRLSLFRNGRAAEIGCD